MARKAANGPLTPGARIMALEAEIARLDKLIEQHQRAMDVQLQRIGQLQADLDAIRAAWTKTSLARKGK